MEGASLRGRVVAALALTVMTTGLVAPASALSTTVSDPSGAPATADVSSVRYQDGERSTVTRVNVRRLPRAGSLVVRIGTASGAAAYVARVRRTSSGALTTTLTYVAGSSREHRACATTALWSGAKDLVQVTVPQSCLAFGRFVVRHRFQAIFAAGGSADRAPARVVGRGDSPGCVTPAEFATLRVGQLMDDVHIRFDTGGRYEGAEEGVVGRSYTGCGDGNSYVVRYAAGTAKVVGWVVLGPAPTRY